MIKLDFLKLEKFSCALPRMYKSGWLCCNKNSILEVLTEDCLLKMEDDSAWSAELEAIHEEPTRTGWIEVYERNSVLKSFGELELNRNNIILEFGASSGYMVEEIKAAYPNNCYIAVDLYDDGLKRSYQRNKDILHIKCDMTNAPFKDNSFDLVYALNVLEHIEDDEKTIGECYRILKKGGYCLFVVPRGQHLYDYFDEMLYHKRRYKLNELKDKAEAVGFKSIKRFHFAWLVYPVFWLKKRINQIVGRYISREKKMKRVEEDLNSAMESTLGTYAMRIEGFLANFINPNFGVREFIVLKK